VERSRRLDETAIEVNGPSDSLSPAVDHAGQSLDVLLTEPRDTQVVTGARA
jgi:transposase-like protein